MYVCLCRGITDSQIKQAISEGKVNCMRSLSSEFGIAGECGKCGKHAKELLKQSVTPPIAFHNVA
ncbi:(2Fe-2S)-binding protein [Pleionea mediterranea]|jgi:bacterioferritin-associated ferredoxin|uniref:Bacterioferritin-associated ferredoxin n=1 Tax=Pleionea mediterranea TaxID=523701 RepID=A0A316FPF4_9GAMM|nr:(2Fe-2S)-binding protein [Pleionea mediterranea]PWK50095.1 bacterioferritin-associated ferredoxin [Pleionea mediterranea]